MLNSQHKLSDEGKRLSEASHLKQTSLNINTCKPCEASQQKSASVNLLCNQAGSKLKILQRSAGFIFTDTETEQKAHHLTKR